MRVCKINAGKKRQCVKLALHFVVSGVVIVLALMLFIYPAIIICALVFDSQLSQTGESRLVPRWVALWTDLREGRWFLVAGTA